MKSSKLLSVLFHPINFALVGSLIYFLLVPKFIYKPQEKSILIVIFIGTYVFPLLLLLLLKKFKMIDSYQMRTIDERKFPTLLFISLCYIIGNWLFKSNMVDLLSLMFFGYGLLLICTYLLFYTKLKLSLHTAAIGGLIGFVICFSHFFRVNLIFLLALLFVLSGLVASARLKLGAHTFGEVIIGFVLGLGTQIAVYLIYLYMI
jgi:hypothetical protein